MNERIDNLEGPLLPKAYCLQIKQEETPWRCQNCSSHFDSRKSLKLHEGLTRETTRKNGENPYEKTPQETFSCSSCRNKFDTFQGLMQHVGKKHATDKNSVCQYCNKTFKHKYAVKFHVNQVHSQVTRSECIYCSKVFYNSYIMKIHCKKCKYRFPNYK